VVRVTATTDLIATLAISTMPELLVPFDSNCTK